MPAAAAYFGNAAGKCDRGCGLGFLRCTLSCALDFFWAQLTERERGEAMCGIAVLTTIDVSNGKRDAFTRLHVESLAQILVQSGVSAGLLERTWKKFEKVWNGPSFAFIAPPARQCSKF
jgi:hypothetical protein